MIGHVANLIRWEWFKLRRRWMPWILLAILLLLSQLAVWGSFFAYRNFESSGGQVFFGAGGPGERDAMVRVSCNDLLAGRIPDLPPGTDPRIIEQFRQSCEQQAAQRQEQLQDMRGSFTLPGSIPSALGVAQGIGLILVAILTASILGTEYGWGTVRSVLVKGTGRWQYLAAKLILMALLAAGALTVVAAVTIISSAVAGALAPEGTGSVTPYRLPPALGGWTDAAIAFGKTCFALLPYVALAGLITVLTTSAAAGMAVALGYYFAELVVVAIFINVFDWFQGVADYVLGRNISAWVMGDRGTPFGAIPIGEFPGELHAFLVLVAYILVLGGLAFWLFQRRDVAVLSSG